VAVVYLGVGSNRGDREANLEKAIALLKAQGDLEITALSAWIETDPEGGPPQGRFLNGVLRLQTDLLPLELLLQLKIIERRLGRVKSEEPNSPRPIDLDILFYDDVVIEGKNLVIPHPRAASRLFVLKPLVQIAPDFVHPRLHRTVRDLYEEALQETRPSSVGGF
jgi:2-amino-4-hydroxy-6-hydroxymethyldihydropteridine diphosphokinase